MSMHHIYTGSKGDPLCPLGFHPQVRWPTRCKRCFRDYKEHGGKSGKEPESTPLRKDEVTMSTPSLSTWNSSRLRDDSTPSSTEKSSSPSSAKDISSTSSTSRFSTAGRSSWTSTPDLTEAETTVSVTLPRRRATADLSSSLDAATRSTEFTVRRRTNTSDPSKPEEILPSNRGKTISEDEAPAKATAKIKVSSSTNTTESLVKKPVENKKLPVVTQNTSKPPVKLKEDESIKKTALKPKEIETTKKPQVKLRKDETINNPEVEFIFKVKSSKDNISQKTNQVIRQTSSVLIPPHGSSSSSSSGTEDSIDDEDDDKSSVTGTETTETTLVNINENELQEEIESLKGELETMKTRCEKAEREKSDILLRRLASYDTTPTRNTASEVLKLQQKANELSTQSEDLRDENKSLTLRVKELQRELDAKKASESKSKEAEELRSKLSAAETLCEELMDENEEMKKELNELENEIEEMRDNFREDQAEEYSSLRKELLQTTKNCRILSFKLRKSERRTEELESNKVDLEKKYSEAVGGQKGLESVEKVKKLEADLKVANEVATRLTKDLEEANNKLKMKETKKAPLLGNLSKLSSGEKMSRSSLTRGGSQDDPQQLLRDLQDSMEREADLREQLRFAEEEAANLRKLTARVEDENDSLALQLKKMATKAKSRRHSPSPNRLTPEPLVEKDEGISEEEDPAELRLMLELNEQETGVLRRKVEQLESELDTKKRKLKEAEEKVTQPKIIKKTGLLTASTPLDKEKLKVVEEECGELRKKLIEKEREIERLQNEVQSPKKRGTLIKSKSLDSDQQALDLKRQLQLVEQEATILRTKIQTLENENENLSAENKKLQLLRVTKKISTSSDDISSDKVSSLESKLAESEKTIKELKEKLEKTEATAKKPATPLLGKSVELDKVKKELKTKSEEFDKVTKEYQVTKDALQRLRDASTEDLMSFYKARTPKRPTDMSTKLQMKKMVEDLENEIGEILVALQKSVSDKKDNSVDETVLNEKEIQIQELEEQLKSEESKNNKKSAEIEAEKATLSKTLSDEKAKVKKLESEKKLVESEKKKMETDLQKLQKEKDSWKTDKKLLQEKIEQLESERKNSVLAQDEVAVFIKKLDNLTKDLEKERETVSKLKDQLASTNKLEEEKVKLQKEVMDRNKQILDLDKKIKEGDEKVKRLEKNVATGKSKITKLEKTMEEAETVRLEREERWKSIQEDLNGQEVLNLSLKSKISELEATIEEKNSSIKSLEDNVRKERERATDASLKAGSAEKREILSLREELSKRIKELEESNKKCEQLEKNRKTDEEARKKIEIDLKKENDNFEKKIGELEVDLNAEKKKIERMKISHEKELKNRETELTALKVKIKSLEQSTGDSSKRVTEVREELTSKIKKLESELSREKQDYEDLTVKYELLEEEHVVTKAQMVMEKEKVQNQLMISKREADGLTMELNTLRETYNNKQDAWIKEKLDLQEELKEKTEKMARACDSKWELEKNRFIAMHEEQVSIADGLKSQNDAFTEQMDHMRKENEEMRKKLVDFDKVEKVQRQIAAESDKLEAELRSVRNERAAEEKNHKTELAAQKLRYESRVNLISEELQSSQGQISRFKRERDAFKHMLEEAQAQMAELKSGQKKDSRLSSTSGDEEEAKETIAALEQQLSVMEDEMSEARLESSKLKTELVSEKSAWEVKLSELQSKVNALEEEKILASGRTKIPGLRTRMELAWAKEREDQHRLLQETSTLARDLRQTLFEVERERDKERLESKRRLEQMKKSTEEEQEENRKKITELQCDLLELRDAHAKLRTTNEKLRREKENTRAQMRARRTDDEDRKLMSVLDQVDNFMRLIPEVLHQKASHLELPYKVRSREPSPMNQKEDSALQLQLTMQRLHHAANELKIARDADDRSRRSASIGVGPKRAGSSEPDSESSTANGRVQRKQSLYRKSLSLSETAGAAAADQAIWKDEQDGSINSLQSLEDHVDHRLQNLGRRETSMDSRLSGGSTQSELIPGDRKKKKGILGKLKRLTKSKSEDTGSHEDFNSFQSAGGSDSDMSAVGDPDMRGSKKDLKERLSGMFKKGTQSRGNSMERSLKPEDASKTLPRSTKSPAKSLPEKSATLGRPLDKSKNPTAVNLRRT